MMKLLTKFYYSLLSRFGGVEAGLAVKVSSEVKGNFIIYGAGEFGAELLAALKKLGTDQKLVGVFDSRAEYQDFSLAEYEVKAPDQLSHVEFDHVVLATEKFVKEMRETVSQQIPDRALRFISLFD